MLLPCRKAFLVFANSLTDGKPVRCLLYANISQKNSLRKFSVNFFEWLEKQGVYHSRISQTDKKSGGLNLFTFLLKKMLVEGGGINL